MVGSLWTAPQLTAVTIDLLCLLGRGLTITPDKKQKSSDFDLRAFRYSSPGYPAYDHGHHGFDLAIYAAY